MPHTDFSRVESALKLALSEDQVNDLGRETGQSKRLRIVTPHRLFLAVVAALAGAKVESLADLLREFNHQNKVCTAYKAFYNRLARPGFAGFMREMFCRLLGTLTLRTLEPQSRSVLSAFEDIVIQDGSSFRVKDSLKAVYPGRFKKGSPAAIELHATFSGFEDNPLSVTLAPDCEAERQFLPSPEDLKKRLLLADRGYPDVCYFEKVARAGGSYVVRISRSYDPWVRVAFVGGKLFPLRRSTRLSRLISKHRGCAMDLDVEFKRNGSLYRYRVVVLPGREKHMTRLATNLDRARFPLEVVGQIYRFRWQVELCFKEWKSYANLHRFDSACEHIVEGLIWASLCAALLKRFLAHAAQLVGRVPMSTRRVAMCARHVIDALVAAVLNPTGGIAGPLRQGLQYLTGNARRAHPQRDRVTGRLRGGLAVVASAK